MSNLISIPDDKQLLESIESFLVRHAMPYTRFGREATGEASFVQTLRDGRKIKLETANRVVAFMQQHDARLAAEAGGASPDNSTSNIGAADSTPMPITQGAALAPGRLPAAGVRETSPAAGQEAGA